MKNNTHRNAAIISVIFGVSIVYVLKHFDVVSNEYFKIFIIATAFTGSNYFAGHYLNLKGLRKGDKKFMIIVFGGMVVRMFLLLLGLILVVSLLNLSKISFIITFFFLYFYFLMLEIMYLSKLNVDIED